MNILEFIRSLNWEMNMYEVHVKWNWIYKCTECGKFFSIEDEAYSCKGSVGEYKSDEGHHKKYPDVYKIPITTCYITIADSKIKIEHNEDGGNIAECQKCFNQPAEKPYCKWYDKPLNEVAEWQQAECYKNEMNCNECDNLEY